ncbi:TPA: hypothetical protein ACXDAY_002346 [Clostridium botulinum]|uniref:hypothetical protein n=2 Tax=Clostridium botulinum TaxID=1491 RepID=UPI0004AD924A|nr:hypothetical protein [Clostridium botulinum]APR02544.1 hypothetical protein RSJ2_4124 [Clostridium botulinum]MBN3359351.1 hypothetical protein [Clostridium botulinum]MBN3367180.1 hypothetical protein [Clostridium botulinum]MBN3371813.1 hypothetical protein [Clostridium botulinum]MBN3375697.1 hypothetical protein [Clostridium botulinum]
MASKPKMKCLGKCQKEKSVDKFYRSQSPKHEMFDGYCPYCKDCLKKLVYINGVFDVEKLKFVLKNYLDKPFFNDIIDNIMTTNTNNPLGMYLKQLNLRKQVGNDSMTWKDGEAGEIKEAESNDNKKNNNYIEKNNVSPKELQRLIDKYGYGYTNEEYLQFEKKWNKLIDNYGEKTALHTENLITYIRFRVKEEMATAEGDVKSAKDWGALATQAAKDAKLNVSQLSKSDISGGVDVVCQIFEALETEIGVIPLLPKLIEQPYDDADLIIWANINYNRRLEDKPMVQYRDIWDFYDEMLEEYFKQQGYDDNKKKEFKEKRNNVFRDLQQVYKEPLYEEDEI